MSQTEGDNRICVSRQVDDGLGERRRHEELLGVCVASPVSVASNQVLVIRNSFDLFVSFDSSAMGGRLESENPRRTIGVTGYATRLTV